ncbi:MAG: 6-phosphofructokinase [Flavobacteriaceae bacterium]
MAKKVSKIGVMTSGGDSPGMNAAIRAVVRACTYYQVKCIGFYRGYEGIIEHDCIELTSRGVKNIINKGGTILKSARSEEFRSFEGRTKAYQNLKAEGIDALVLIGGDGTFTGGALFSKEFDIPVIGIPGTIDNDIYGTQFTIGYDTALNTVVDAVDKIRDTASSHNRLFFIEVMGRDAGFIALNSGVGAGAEEILIPEEDQPLEKLIESLQRSKKNGKTSSIVIVAEGDKTGKNVFELAEYVKENLEDYSPRVTVLGHLQRGGSPTCFDRVLASRLGVRAVELLLEGEQDVMVGIRNNMVVSTPIVEIMRCKNSVNKELLRIADILSI